MLSFIIACSCMKFVVHHGGTENTEYLGCVYLFSASEMLPFDSP